MGTKQWYRIYWTWNFIQGDGGDQLRVTPPTWKISHGKAPTNHEPQVVMLFVHLSMPHSVGPGRITHGGMYMDNRPLTHSVNMECHLLRKNGISRWVIFKSHILFKVDPLISDRIREFASCLGGAIAGNS